jgi:hypothetical protein
MGWPVKTRTPVRNGMAAPRVVDDNTVSRQEA